MTRVLRTFRWGNDEIAPAAREMFWLRCLANPSEEGATSHIKLPPMKTANELESVNRVTSYRRDEFRRYPE